MVRRDRGVGAPLNVGLRHDSGCVNRVPPTMSPGQIGGGFFVFFAKMFLFALFEIEHHIDVVFNLGRGTICSMDTPTPGKRSKRLDSAKRLVC